MILKNLFFLGLSLFTSIAIANTHAWVQLGPEGQPVARAILSESICPELQIDGKIVQMDVRAPAYGHFEVTTCEAILPQEAQVVKLSDQLLPIPKKEINRIIVFGDTGCVLSPTGMQGCSDLKEWPFKTLIDQAALMAPDLVIHLGDYWYREMPCMLKKTCQNSPYGNTWAAWDADFFTPAENLLKVAPWVFVRGNHENCYRGGLGWFRFLDANVYTETCETHVPLYKIPMGSETLFVMDSSEAQDAWAPSVLVESFRKEFKKIQESNSHNVWLLTHKPLWEMDMHHGAKTLKTAAEGEWPSNIKWIFSGHVHNFEVLNVSNGPTQFIVGSGGGLLQSEKSKSISPKVQGIESRHFGFLMLTRKNGVWEGDFYDTEGMIREHCISAQAGGVSCVAIPVTEKQ